VTDANVVLGYLNRADRGRGVPIDAKAAANAWTLTVAAS